MDRFYEKAINKVMEQIRLSHFTLKREEEESPPFEKIIKPHITVSRDPGSGGRPIAKLVAESLGFDFYDKKLVLEIAKSAKLRKESLKAIDEKSRNAMSDLIHNIFNPDYVDDLTYIRYLCKTILSIAYKGRVVILGRGGNFITPASTALHVRITAPYSVRLTRSIKYEKISREKAKKRLSQIDKNRREFIKQYFGKNISSSRYYDLVLNTEFMTLEDARDIIITAFKKKFPKY